MNMQRVADLLRLASEQKLLKGPRLNAHIYQVDYY